MRIFRSGTAALQWEQAIKLRLSAETHQILNELAQLEQCSIHDLILAMITLGIEERQFHYHFPELWDSLTQREQQVAALACLGYANNEIAHTLTISINTVKTHISRILRKFSVGSKNELGRLLVHIDFLNWLQDGGLL